MPTWQHAQHLALGANGLAGDAHPRPFQRLGPALQKPGARASSRVVAPGVNADSAAGQTVPPAPIGAEREREPHPSEPDWIMGRGCFAGRRPTPETRGAAGEVMNYLIDAGGV